MKIRLLKPYLFHAEGAVIDTFGDPVCQLLIERGAAERISEPQQKAKRRGARTHRGKRIETAAVDKPTG